MIGKIISHYTIKEKLGEGGMGVIYKGEDLRLNRTVALKVLPESFTKDEDSKRRFIFEAQSASSLQHNNICTIHEIDETYDGQFFIAMDYYEGETLKIRISRGLIDVDEIINIITQIAEGLKQAHEPRNYPSGYKTCKHIYNKRRDSKNIRLWVSEEH